MILTNNKILIQNIPLKSPTGKYRLKRPKEKFISYVAQEADRTILENDYLEWQISYYLNFNSIYRIIGDIKSSLFDVFVADEKKEYIEKLYETFNNLKEDFPKKRSLKIEFKKKFSEINKQFNIKEIQVTQSSKEVLSVLFELSDYLKLFFDNNIITTDNLEEIEKFAYETTDNIDTHLLIERESNTQINSLYSFNVLSEKYPIMTKEINKNFEIEIVRKHKQYAVGYQNMVYICVRARNMKDNDGNTIVGANYDDINKVNYELDSDTVLEATKAFTLISEIHKKDILEIIKVIK